MGWIAWFFIYLGVGRQRLNTELLVGCSKTLAQLLAIWFISGYTYFGVTELVAKQRCHAVIEHI